MTKIYVGRDLVGRFTCDGRKYTKWGIIKLYMKTFAKRTLFVMAGFSALGWAAVGGSSYFPRIVKADVIVDKSSEQFIAKLETLKDEVVTDIGPNCESKGYSKDEPVIIFDVNKVASLGAYQFQVKTVQYYYKALYGQTITPKEATLIALDNDKAHQLAKDVMFKTKAKASKDWVNCANKMNADARIDIIKSLES